MKLKVFSAPQPGQEKEVYLKLTQELGGTIDLSAYDEQGKHLSYLATISQMGIHLESDVDINLGFPLGNCGTLKII